MPVGVCNSEPERLYYGFRGVLEVLGRLDQILADLPQRRAGVGATLL